MNIIDSIGGVAFFALAMMVWIFDKPVSNNTILSAVYIMIALFLFRGAED